MNIPVPPQPTQDYTFTVRVSDLGRDDHDAEEQLKSLKGLKNFPFGLNFRWNFRKLALPTGVAQATGRSTNLVEVETGQTQAQTHEQLGQIAERVKQVIWEGLQVDVHLVVECFPQVIKPDVFPFVPTPRCPGCGLALRTARHPELFTANGYHDAECEARYGPGAGLGQGQA